MGTFFFLPRGLKAGVWIYSTRQNILDYAGSTDNVAWRMIKEAGLEKFLSEGVIKKEVDSLSQPLMAMGPN